MATVLFDAFKNMLKENKMTKHPITIEKECLKEIAAKITDLKLRLQRPHRNSTQHYMCGRPTNRLSSTYLVHLADMQADLAKLKRQYCNRHFAYCRVRQSLSSKFVPWMPGNIGSAFRKGPIMSSRSKVKLDTDVVNMHTIKLLTAIAKTQSDRIDALKDELDDKPYIALFKPKTGRERKLYIKDFTRNEKGDFVWTVKKPGMILDKNMERPVSPDDTVNLEKSEYDKLPPELKSESKSKPVFWSSVDNKWYFWDETGTLPYGPYATAVEAEAELNSYCKTYLSFDTDAKNFTNPVMHYEEAASVDVAVFDSLKTRNFAAQIGLDLPPTKNECYLMVKDYLEDSVKAFERCGFDPPEYDAWRLVSVWAGLPVNDLVTKTQNTYEICGKQFSKYLDVQYVIDWLKYRLLPPTKSLHGLDLG